MKSKLRCNFAIILLLTLINCFLSRARLQVFPMEEIENDDFNPFNAFLNFDRMAKDIMGILLFLTFNIENKLNQRRNYSPKFILFICFI